MDSRDRQLGRRDRERDERAAPSLCAEPETVLVSLPREHDARRANSRGAVARHAKAIEPPTRIRICTGGAGDSLGSLDEPETELYVRAGGPPARGARTARLAWARVKGLLGRFDAQLRQNVRRFAKSGLCFLTGACAASLWFQAPRATPSSAAPREPLQHATELQPSTALQPKAAKPTPVLAAARTPDSGPKTRTDAKTQPGRGDAAHEEARAIAALAANDLDRAYAAYTALLERSPERAEFATMLRAIEVARTSAAVRCEGAGPCTASD